MVLRKYSSVFVVSMAAVIAGGAAVVSASTTIDQVGLDIDGEAADDRSGYSVSLSSDGTIVAIGADDNDGNGNDSGHVRIYEWDGNAWTQKGVDIDGEAANDRSGHAVSLSSDGTTIAIGAYSNDGNGNDSGHVRIFEWDGTAWQQKGVDIDGEAEGDRSGYSVSLSSDGTIVAIGADDNDDNGNDSGHVRIFEWDGTAWQQKGGDIDGEAEGDRSGYSVSLSSDGTIVAIGAYRNDDNGNNSGHVRIYEWDGNAWTQKGGDIDGEAAEDQSGGSTSLSSDGTIVAIGAIGNDGNGTSAGHVRIYEWDGNTWQQKGTDIDGEAENDYSGDVSLSSDGTIAAIGARYNDGTDVVAGHVRIYEWDGNAWTQKGGDIDGEAGGDYLGWRVSLTSDGTAVAAGAYGNDGNGPSSGHVRVYSIVSTLNITYDSQGGSAVSDGDATTTTGGTISALPSDPTRDGYTFAGWFTAASGGTGITTNTAHNQTTDFTLYAQWTANPTTTTTTGAPTTTTTVTPTTTTVLAETTVPPTTTSTPEPDEVLLPATGSNTNDFLALAMTSGMLGAVLALTAIVRRRAGTL